MEKNIEKAIKITGKILDAWLPYKIQHNEIPGLSVGIVYKGKLVYKAGFGYADLKSKIKATPKTCYRIASISKTFTSVAILQLAEKGKLNIDDPVEKYLPWFKAKNKVGDSKNITIKQLLSHTGGVFRDGTTPHWEDDNFPTREELRKSVSGKTLVFKNQTHFKYSNFGFALLGQVIEKASGMTYDEYVSLNILNKIGLKNTWPDLTEKNKVTLAKGYSRKITSGKTSIFLNAKTNTYASATGFISNVFDLAKYVAALSAANPKSLLLSQESKKKMQKKHWKTDKEGGFYGLGLEIYKIGKKKIIGHGGGFCGFITKISLDTKNDIGIITLSNTIENFVSSINKGIIETIHGLVDEKNKYNLDKKLLGSEKYKGIYRSRWSDEAVCAIGENLVVFNVGSNSPLKDNLLLTSSGKDEFIIETKNNFDSIGEITRFVFNKKNRKAEKVIFGATPADRLE